MGWAAIVVGPREAMNVGGYGSRPSPGRRSNKPRSSIIRLQIIRDAGGLVERSPVVGIAIQQRARLRLIVRRDVVGLIDRLRQDVAIIVVGRLRADEDADAMHRLG